MSPEIFKCALGAKLPLVENHLSTIKSKVLGSGIEDTSEFNFILAFHCDLQIFPHTNTYLQPDRPLHKVPHWCLYTKCPLYLESHFYSP